MGDSEVYAYYSKRVSDGYRDHSETDAEYAGVRLHHALSDTVSVTAGYASSEYRIQLAGPVTDAMFATDPEQATRARNYYSPRIYERKTGIEVRVVALGTGQALDLARRGDADVVFVHAKSAEEQFVRG